MNLHKQEAPQAPRTPSGRANSVKLNKGNIFTVELPCHLLQSFADPRERSPIYYPSRRKEDFFPYLATAQPMRHSHNSANENLLYFKLLVYSSGLCVYNSPLTTHPRPKVPLLCSWYLSMAFVTACLSRILIPLLFLNKPNAGKITGCFTFRVNDSRAPHQDTLQSNCQKPKTILRTV